MPYRRHEYGLPAIALATVFILDLCWSLGVGSTGSIAYGLIDPPAHLLTCAILLWGFALVVGGKLPGRFVVAALVASVAIDLDHLPAYLGADFLTGSLPRPYTHGLLVVLAVLFVGVGLRRTEWRQVGLGVAFGIAAHLLRDTATGPGVSVLWPIADSPMMIPYALYAILLSLPMIACLPRRRLAFARGSAALLTVAVFALAVVPTSASAHRIAMGTYVRGFEDSPGLLDRYADDVGRAPAIIDTFKRWDVAPFYSPELHEIASRGAVPMISWEPWTSDDHGFSLAAIAHGRYDRFVRSSAREAKKWGGPILLRFGQEMNGSWAPWQRGRNGTTGPRFVAAWRHMVKVFRQEGADNVYWVWCPYVSNGLNPFMDFYPGGRWVNWIALDGYNWGEPRAWQSFSKIFDRSYRTLAKVAPKKPFMIAEIGSGEAGGSKAAWLNRTFRRQLPRLRRIKAVVWFDAVDGSDFRVDSSPAALDAFRNGIARRLYSGSGSWVARLSRHSG